MISLTLASRRIILICNRYQSLVKNFNPIRKLNNSPPRRTSNRLSDFDDGAAFPKDTVIFRNDNLGQLRVYQFIGGVNLFLWVYLIGYGVHNLRAAGREQRKLLENNPNFKTDSFWKWLSLLEERHHYKVMTALFLIGYGTAFLISLYSVRSVHTIVIRKGGKEVSILTSRMIAISKLRELRVPLKDVSCKTSREQGHSFATLKVKGHPFYFMIDTAKGTIYNPYLFDRTVGLRRNLV